MDNQIFDSKAMGQRIRALRTGLGLSRGEFAKEVEAYSGNAVHQWECGHSAPSLEVTIKICNHFNVNIDDLVLGLNPRKTH